MSINVFQAILIGLWTAFCFSGMLLGIYTNRCIVLSFGVGIILGDLPTALAMGAIGELAYKRLLPSLLRLLWRFNSYKLSLTLYVLEHLKRR